MAILQESPGTLDWQFRTKLLMLATQTSSALFLQLKVYLESGQQYLGLKVRLSTIPGKPEQAGPDQDLELGDEEPSV